MSMRKTGIMGGTFNPIHKGHLLLAETARIQYGLDEVLFIPSGISYMKQNQKIPDGKVRAAMAALATEDTPYFNVSFMEIERLGNTYTYETLQELRRQNPDTEYFFLVGADSLFAMEHWRKPEQIFASCNVLAAVRGDSDKTAVEKKAARLTKKYHGHIGLLDCNAMDISSTQIRERIQKGESVKDLVPDKVIQYIEEKNLYKL